MSKGKGPSQATELVMVANLRYWFVRSTDGVVYAVPHEGPLVLTPLDGSFRSILAAVYFEAFRAAAGRNALAEAVETLRGGCQDGAPDIVDLRHATRGTVRALDLGGPSGDIITFGPSGWNVRESGHDFLFRRTALSDQLPLPARTDDPLSDLEQLGDVLNVSGEDDWRLLVGWMVAVLLADVAAPVLYLSGEQGTGKTSFARVVVSIVDPSTVPVRAAPKDLEGWIVAAAGSRVVAVDNLSAIADWLSDALCRAVTGEGLVRRRLYTNDDLAVTSYRRAVILTTIDAGALRGDLGERLLPIELERIPDHERRTDADLNRALAAIRPSVLGALLEVACGVLDQLITLELADPPRMADFGRVLAALDALTGWATLDAYRHRVAQTLADLANGNALAETLVGFVRTRGEWSGTAGELLAALARPEGAQAWPRTAQGMGRSVVRLAGSLRAVGIEVRRSRRGDKTNSHVITLSDVSTRSDVSDASPSVAALSKKRETGQRATEGTLSETSETRETSDAHTSTLPAHLCETVDTDAYEAAYPELFDEPRPRPVSAFDGFLA